ncbi:MAG: hypothetical protein FJ096_17215 [Deltaproteobacteria bacterium]|nr:hypothetical protein [Deltaproteobacteria bacterium]
MSASVNGLANVGVNASAPDPSAANREPQRTVLAGRSSRPAGAKPDEAGKLHDAAMQFEAVFVRQLLKAAKFGEDMGSSGHASMALEALADSVTRQGGLGLAKAIEDTLRKTELSARAPQRKESP